MRNARVIEDWIDGDSGLHCAVSGERTGVADGYYVAVGPTHPWFGKRHDGDSCGHTGCRDHLLSAELIERPLTYSGADPAGTSSDEWWLGCEDGPPCDWDDARLQCEDLARQLVLIALVWGLF